MTNREAVTYTLQRFLMAATFGDSESERWEYRHKDAERVCQEYGEDADWESSWATYEGQRAKKGE